MTLLSRACVSISISLKLYLYVVPFLRYSASKKNGVTLKLGVGVVQGHWKWRRSIDHTTFYWSAIISIAVCCITLSYLTLNHRDLEKVTEGHSNWYHSKVWVRSPIRLP